MLYSFFIILAYSKHQVKNVGSGHLNNVTLETLVTAEVLEKLSFEEGKQKTFMSEEEHKKEKQIFTDKSGECI